MKCAKEVTFYIIFYLPTPSFLAAGGAGIGREE
jgi:hypothetical protein